MRAESGPLLHGFGQRRQSDPISRERLMSHEEGQVRWVHGFAQRRQSDMIPTGKAREAQKV
jgi:hypothetical protein